MAKRFAKEWLWLLTAAIIATALTIVFRNDLWRVGETGVALVLLYGLSAFVRITMWAVRTARETATT
jgi:hypothetical protein